MSVLWMAVLAISVSPLDKVDPLDQPASMRAGMALAPSPLRTGRELEQAARDALRRWFRTGDKDADAAARELLVLYKELQQDQQMSPKSREELRLRVRGRLAQLALQISKRVAKQAKMAKGGPKSVRVSPDAMVLGQRGGMMGGGGAAAAMAGQQAASDDNGEQLVDLIQQTVAPKTWEVNGGPGTIYYWRNQRAIVARTTDEVHEEISNVLEQLNRASH